MAQLANSALVTEAKEAAQTILEKDITMKTYPLLKTKISELRERLHLE
ncbi:MAG: hypothetical protein HYV78_00845 [Candidatus Wildermuthbacteria bacterium]|nr:hypothetical protein [Candidatus Wildermuthbacteria bacterium]